MKKAFSLIELIVAIVIIGLAISTFPMFIYQSNENNLLALQQEAIMNAKTQMLKILAYDWDKNSYYFLDQKHYILETTNGDEELKNAHGLTGLSGRRGLKSATLSSEISASPIHFFPTQRGIEDFDGLSVKLRASIDAKQFDYLFQNITIKSSINYVNDASLSGYDGVNSGGENILRYNFSTTNTLLKTQTSNIKLISVQSLIKIDDKIQKITFHAYACNIGESKPIAPKDF